MDNEGMDKEGMDKEGVKEGPYTEFAASGEVIKEPTELRLGEELNVIYGDKTGRVDMVIGRNPNSLSRMRFDSSIGAGRKVFLRDEKGGRLGDVSRRAVEARYSRGRWIFLDLKTGEGQVVVTKTTDNLNNLTVNVSNGYQLRVGSVSQRSGETGPRIESFIFERKRN